MVTETDNKVLGNSERSIKAIISLILGILSLILSIIPIGFVLGIIGLIYGFLGLRKIKRTEQKGRDIAIAGVACSLIGIVLPFIFFILYLRLTSVN